MPAREPEDRSGEGRSKRRRTMLVTGPNSCLGTALLSPGPARDLDPRVTRVGTVLRTWSLDELPQLWNVLVGQMSLVGPRPIVDAEVEKYDRAFDLYTKVRPGMTGHWQVSGRNDTGYEERVAMDAYYVRNWSVWLDIVILVKTVGVVLQKDGAY